MRKIGVVFEVDDSAKSKFAGIAAAARRAQQDVDGGFTSLAARYEQNINRLGTTATILATMGFRSLKGAIGGVTGELRSLSDEFVKVNERFGNLQITLTSTLKSFTAARDIVKEVARITARSPLPFQDIATTIQSFSLNPVTSSKYLQQAMNGTLSSEQGFLRRSVGLVEKMNVFRPDQDAESALFALREALGGQIRSLIRRFDVPSKLIYSGTGWSESQIKNDPDKMFEALYKMFSRIVTPQAVAQYSMQPTVLAKNYREQILETTMYRVGQVDEKSGKSPYQSLLVKGQDIYNQLVEFMNSENGVFTTKLLPKIRDSLSDTLQKIYGAIDSAIGKLLDHFGGDSTGDRIEQIASFATNTVIRIADYLSNLAEKLAQGDILSRAADLAVMFFKAAQAMIEGFVKLADLFGPGAAVGIVAALPLITTNLGSLLRFFSDTLPNFVKGTRVSTSGAATAASMERHHQRMMDWGFDTSVSDMGSGRRNQLYNEYRDTLTRQGPNSSLLGAYAMFNPRSPREWAYTAYSQDSAFASANPYTAMALKRQGFVGDGSKSSFAGISSAKGNWLTPMWAGYYSAKDNVSDFTRSAASNMWAGAKSVAGTVGNAALGVAAGVGIGLAIDGLITGIQKLYTAVTENSVATEANTKRLAGQSAQDADDIKRSTEFSAVLLGTKVNDNAKAAEAFASDPRFKALRSAADTAELLSKNRADVQQALGIASYKASERYRLDTKITQTREYGKLTGEVTGGMADELAFPRASKAFVSSLPASMFGNSPVDFFRSVSDASSRLSAIMSDADKDNLRTIVDGMEKGNISPKILSERVQAFWDVIGKSDASMKRLSEALNSSVSDIKSAYADELEQRVSKEYSKGAVSIIRRIKGGTLSTSDTDDSAKLIAQEMMAYSGLDKFSGLSGLSRLATQDSTVQSMQDDFFSAFDAQYSGVREGRSYGDKLAAISKEYTRIKDEVASKLEAAGKESDAILADLNKAAARMSADDDASTRTLGERMTKMLKRFDPAAKLAELKALDAKGLDKLSSAYVAAKEEIEKRYSVSSITEILTEQLKAAMAEMDPKTGVAARTYVTSYALDTTKLMKSVLGGASTGDVKVDTDALLAKFAGAQEHIPSMAKWSSKLKSSVSSLPTEGDVSAYGFADSRVKLAGVLENMLGEMTDEIVRVSEEGDSAHAKDAAKYFKDAIAEMRKSIKKLYASAATQFTQLTDSAVLGNAFYSGNITGKDKPGRSAAILREAGYINYEQNTEQVRYSRRRSKQFGNETGGAIGATTRQYDLARLLTEEARKNGEEQEKIAALVERQNLAYEAMIDKQREQSFGGFMDGLTEGLSTANDELYNMASLGEQIGDGLKNSFGNAFGEMVTGAKTAKQAFGDMARSMLKWIAELLARKAVEGLLNLAISSFMSWGASNIGSGPTTANSYGASIGSNTPGGVVAAEGGRIYGGSGVRDDIPATLMGGEYVIKKAAAQRIGYSTLDAMNSGRMTHFASGGAVGVASSSYSPVVSARSGNITTSSNVSVQINVDGNSKAATNVKGLDEKRARELGENIEKIVNERIVQESRYGGVIYNTARGLR